MQVRSGHISTSGRPSGEEHWSLSSAGLVEEKRAKTTVQTVFPHFLIVPFYFVLNTVFCNGLLFHFTGLRILPPGARGIFSKGGSTPGGGKGGSTPGGGGSPPVGPQAGATPAVFLE